MVVCGSKGIRTHDDRTKELVVLKGNVRDRLRPMTFMGFRNLWLAQFASAAGDRLMDMAMVFLALELSHNVSAIGMAMMATFVPRVLLTVLGGVWADRVSRLSLMVYADVVRFLVQMLIFGLALTSVLTLSLFVTLCAVYGAASAFFTPASNGVIPELVPKDQIGSANALIKLSRSSLALASPGIGAVLLLQIKIPLSRPSTSATFVTDLLAGLREVIGHPWLAGMIGYFALWNLAVGPMFVLGPYVADHWLGGPNAWASAMTGGTAGVILGGVVALRWPSRGRPLNTILLVMLLPCLHCAALALILPTPIVTITMAVTMGSLTYCTTQWATLLQQEIPGDRLSRVSAYDYLGGFATLPLGYALAGPLSDRIGVVGSLWTVTAVLAGLTMTALLVLRGHAQLQRQSLSQVSVSVQHRGEAGC
jgi:MFS family permease